MKRYAGVVVGGAVGMYLGMKQHDKLEIALAKLASFVNSPLRQNPLATAQSFMQLAVETTGQSKYGVLSTVNADGGVSSRAVQPFAVEFDRSGNPEIYFNTNKFTKKVTEMSNNSKVAMAYLNPAKMSCVTYVGEVERVPYPESTRHWEQWLYAVFPEGNDESKGSRFTTWRLKPSSIQYVSISDNIGSERVDGKSPELVYDRPTGKWVVYSDGKEEDPKK
jgi:general stress protein 26